MNIDAIRALYDHDQRLRFSFPTMRREATPEVVRYVSHHPDEPCILLHSRLDETNADRVIREQIAYFAKLGRPFEWKVYDHDTPPDLQARLAAHGFQIDEAEAIMVLDLAHLPQALTRPPQHDVRRITHPAGIRDLSAVERIVWGREKPTLDQQLMRDLVQYPDMLSVYVAYVDDRPVAGAWVYFEPGSRFASLWGGSTLADYRGRGIYTDLVAVRAREAKTQGRRFLTVDASPMSRPILERQGFRCIAMARACMKKIRD